MRMKCQIELLFIHLLFTMWKRRRLLLGFLALCEDRKQRAEEERRRKRTVWSREIYLDRNRESVFETLMEKLKKEGEDFYKKFVRITFDEFECIHEKIKSRIQKQDTNMRQAITTQERLAVTLFYLASGN